MTTSRKLLRSSIAFALVLGLLWTPLGRGRQRGGIDAVAERLLSGAIDIHVHSDPDDRARSIDAIDVAKLAKMRGMRAIVLKNHYDPTGPLAYIVRKEVPGI